MKRQIKILMFILLFIQLLWSTKSIAIDNTNNYTQEELAIRELANAYYIKGTNMQYDGWRLSQLYPPEEATSQHETYTCCTNYTYSIYYQAFGINGGYINSNRMIAYASKYYDPNNTKTNDVIEYWQKKTDSDGNAYYEDNKGNRKDIDLTTVDGRKEYARYLINDVGLKVGDIICYHKGGSGSGHAVIAYEIKYDKNGNPEDVLFRESTSKYDTATNKITKGLCYMDYYNELTDVHEGTHRELNLIAKHYINQSIASSNGEYNRHSVAYNFQNQNYFAIIRTLLRDNNGNFTGNYYEPTFQYDSKAPTKVTCTGRTRRSYQITDITKQRIKYSGIDIEKTVDVCNGSTVNIGDTLEYKIRVTNTSGNTYSDFDVVENIPEFVEVVDKSNGTQNGSVITWKVSNLGSKQTREIKYKVRAKIDVSNIGKEIVSTGTVAGIPSATVKNPISRNMTQAQKTTAKNKLQEILNTNNNSNYTGKTLVTKIYNEAFGVSLNLNFLDITDLVQVAQDEGSVEKNYDINSYRDEDGDSWYQRPTVYINSSNTFANMMLPNYYNALRTNSNGNIYQRYWENLRSKTISRSDRVDNIRKENFQTGDILVFKNTQSPKDDNSTFPTENGTYYLIYIAEADKVTINGNQVCGFIGIDDSGNIKQISQDYIDMRNILARDYYVVLRPSRVFDLLPMNLKVNYSTTATTIGEVKVTITSNEEMLPVSGWTLATDKKSISKTYSQNTQETVKVQDYGGVEKTANVNISNIVKDLTVQYQTHVQIDGWQGWKSNGQTSGTEGRSLRLEGIKISIQNLPAGASILYKTHVQNVGWQNWKKNGEMAGTEGRSLRLEGIKIKLQNLDGYTVKYRVHVQNIGWQDWRYDGQMAGTEGQSLRLEAIQIVIVNKIINAKVENNTAKTMYYSNDKINDVGTYYTNLKNNTLRAYINGVDYTKNLTSKKISPLDPDIDQERYSYNLSINDIKQFKDGINTIKISLVDSSGKEVATTSREIIVNTKDIHIFYKAHVQDIGWQSKEFKDGETAGTTGRSKRMEAISIRTQNLPQGVSILTQAHVQDIGWMQWTSDNKIVGTTGRSLRLEAIRIKLNNDDNYTLKYRAHVANIGWQDWKYDGEMAGTTGMSNAIEAIEIVLMPKVYRTIIGLDNAARTLYSEDTYLTGYYLTNTPNTTLEAKIDNQSVTNQIQLSANNNIYSQHEGYGDSTNTAKPMYKIFLSESFIDSLKTGNHSLEFTVKLNGTRIYSKKYAIKVDIDNIHIRYTINNYNAAVSQMDDIVLENGKSITDVKAHLINNNQNIKLEYMGYFTNRGWSSHWSTDNSIETFSNSKLQAVRFKLDSNQYSIQYKVKIDGAWQDYAYDGEYAGIVRENKEITGIRIKIVPKITQKKAMVWIDSPNTNLKRGKYTFSGWGVSNDPGATLKLLLDGNQINMGKVNRQDVLDIIKGYKGDVSTPVPGYEASVDLSNAKYGTHKVELQCISSEGKILTSKVFNFNIQQNITIEKGTYGKSGLKRKGTGGYNLEYYRFGDGPNVAFFTFEVHGFEDHWDRDGTELTITGIKFIEKLARDKDMDLANKWTIYIFPECNPDGKLKGYTKDGPGRTTLYSIYGDVGVDMNRCWSTNFEPKYNNRNYTGDFSFGAYEAQYLKDFMLSHKSQNGQTLVVDCHGWLSQLIGDTDMMNYYYSEFPSSRKTYTYGKGYLISWARANLGSNGRAAKSILVELPATVNNPNDFVNQNVANKFINASINMLKGIN